MPPSSPTIVGSAVETIVWSSDASRRTSTSAVKISRTRCAGSVPGTEASSSLIGVSLALSPVLADEQGTVHGAPASADDTAGSATTVALADEQGTVPVRLARRAGAVPRAAGSVSRGGGRGAHRGPRADEALRRLHGR